MASIRLIRRRIKTARNIAQITKAMQLVAASKMKKAQTQAQAGKIYAERIYGIVRRLARKVYFHEHPLLHGPRRLTGKRLVVLISSNKGLCGALNANLFRFVLQQYPDIKRHDFVTVGKKGAGLVARSRVNLKADFSQTLPFSLAVPALTQLVTSQYLVNLYDGVDLIFSEFISALKQIPKRKAILPLAFEASELTPEGETSSEPLVEPSQEAVFEALLPHYLENQIRDAILEAEASEHSARMVAMQNATDNALSFIYDLTLLYNKARQEKITYEISDMVTARLAVE